MKLVHLADLHLGFRRFDRVDASQRNVRERDVMKTFATLIDQVIAIAPDVVVIGGDVFHSKSPANTIIVEAFAGFARLMTALPSLTCIMVGGNHDAPLDTATTNILTLFEQLGIRVVSHDATRIDVPALELSVLAVPDRPGMVAPSLEPNPDAKYNVLVLHGEVGDAIPDFAREAWGKGLTVSLDQIQPDRWTYVALGHYHVYSELAPNVFYAGSSDYTSTDPWKELREEATAGLKSKGFIERDLATGAHTFHELPRTRDHIDLMIDAAGMGEDELNAAIEEALDDAWPDDAICRVIIGNCLYKQSALDATMLRKYKARALNLQLELRKPVEIVAGTPRPIGTYRRPPSLEEMMGALLMKRELPSDVSLEGLTKLSQGYLAQATADNDPLPDMPALAS